MFASNRSFRRRFSVASIGPGPEPQKRPLMDEQQLRLLGYGLLEQLDVRRDAGGERYYVDCARDLQAIRAVVIEALRLEDAVELGDDLGCCNGGHGANISDMGYCWGVGAWRSLVARAVRVGEVPGSNPGAPIDSGTANIREHGRRTAKRLTVAGAVFAAFRGRS